ncbi:MAG: ATP synthase F0 subunit B [Candidatus Omnitrophica bacterium CG07_land_8_20_14_0_80_42_15]|uniref:ATP synthase subunit b n=1 Tax=Candidatus Aquitaenariimonas noxiae TaxID=1974741 RepID=A0A2J0KYT0_9BACT|nr:MAG: ATP synthase F0 subunit B [Candidatus Omnitrophica bacterium CG07_land_8_20_14_0_80_42_15]
MELLKLLSTSEIVAQVINFLLLLFILRIFLWKRILKLLDERKERISSGLKSIEDSKAEIERLKAEYETQLSSIENIARERIKEAVKEGSQVVNEIKKKAQMDAEKIIEAAKIDMKHEVARAKENLKDEIIALTMKATESLIEAKFTEENDKKLIGDFLKQVDETK